MREALGSWDLPHAERRAAAGGHSLAPIVGGTSASPARAEGLPLYNRYLISIPTIAPFADY